jgi:ABC-type multidrug transport system fused ATPase/permease subunit
MKTTPIQQLRSSTLVRSMKLMGPRFWPYASSFLLENVNNAFCFNVALTLILKDVIDAAQQGRQDLLTRALILAGVTFLGGLLLDVATSYICIVCIRRTYIDLRVRLFHHLSALPLAEFEYRHSGDLVSRATNDLQKTRQLYWLHLRNISQAILWFAFSMGAIFIIDWRLGGIALALGLVTLLGNTVFIRQMQQISAQLQEHIGKLTEQLMNLLQSLNVTKMFGLQALVHSKFRQVNAQVAGIAVNQGDKRTVVSVVNVAYGQLSTFGLLGAGLYLFMHQELSLGGLWAIVSFSGLAGFFFQNIGQFLTNLQESLAAAARIFELLDLPVETRAALQTTLVLFNTPTRDMIAFNKVGFSYKNGDAEQAKTVLADLDLCAESGKVTALVGPSGGGKSTILKLILGFYPEQAGEICLNGVPARQIPLEQLRAMTAYVPQESFLFSGTIEENILMGRPEASTDDVILAARSAHAHEFILEQPEGYQTRVGERGANLSGGQRQRIAIARALLKDVPILLLDEATSSLDSESEQEVQKALNNLMRGRTTLVIAHRLSTIEHADKICVVSEGRVVEEGKHRSLLEKKGLYTQLYEMQFQTNPPT